MRIKALRYLVLGATLAAVSACQQSDSPQSAEDKSSPPPDGRPNILLILADDLGFTDAGFFGGEIPTPNLDELALGGLRFTNFHVAPSCQQTRAMLMSGMTTREAGVIAHNDALRTDLAALPERLRAAGYHTYMAGKWNLGINADESPNARGFDASFALMPPGDNHLGHSNFPDEAVPYREHGAPVSLPDDWFSSRLYTDKLIEYIDANADDGAPWFGYLAFTAPHWPLQLPDDWIDRHAGRYDDGYDVLRDARISKGLELGIYPKALSVDGYVVQAQPWAELTDEERARHSRAMELYAAMTENMDTHVGRIIDYLRESGEFGNTVIVFASDNGPDGNDSNFVPTVVPRTDTDNSLANMGRRGSFTLYGRGWSEAATAPYRDIKGSLHSGGTLAASFIHHPAVADKGGLDHSYLTIMDLLPTFVQIAEAPITGNEFGDREMLPVRGESFWGLVTQADDVVRDESVAVPWMTAAHRRALVRWPWKIITDQGARPSGPLRWNLFNLETDPGERQDLSSKNPELKSELMAIWARYGEQHE